MVVVENQYFDIQPQKDNNNYLFDEIINTVPVSHPRSGEGYRNNSDLYYGDTDRHWFRKRKGFQKVPLFKWNDDCSVTAESDRGDGQFTDMAIFEGHRWFLRVNKDRTRIRLYVQWFVNPEECTDGVYYPITAGQIINVGERDFAPCAYDKFTPAWGLKYKNQKDYSDGDWYVRAVKQGTSLERVIYDKSGKYKITDQDAYIRLNDSGMVVQNGGKVCSSVSSKTKLPDNTNFIVGAMAKQYNYYNNPTKCESLLEIPQDTYENKIKGGITIASGMGNTLAFVTLDGLASISSFGQKNPEDFPGCFDISLFDIPGSSFKNDGIIITSVTTINDCLAVLRSNDTFIVSGAGQNQSWFPAGDLFDNGDRVLGLHTAPLGTTDIIGYQSYLLLIGPHDTYYFHPSYNNEYGGVFQITDRSGYFSKGSRAVKDGKVFIARSSNDLYILEGNTGYGGSIAWDWTYYSGNIHRHLRPLNKIHDKITIDLTDNNTYVLINDNTDYSKILIQDRQYNYWYTWIVNGCLITHIKHGIYFGDQIYDYIGETDLNNEIVEMVSATWGDETLSGPKHFVNFKLALGKHSKITDNTTLESSVFSGGEEYRNRMPITTTKYPSLIFDKSAPTGLAFKYDIGKEIHSDGPEKDNSLQTEIQEYRDFKTPQEWSNPMDKTRIAPYGSIRESVNQDGELIKFVVVSRGTDEFEFGGIFLGYHAVDYDYGNIADAVIYPDIPTYQSERFDHSLPAVEDPSVLGHF